ncbi:HAD family hydrolase [Streptomyces sp. NPDC087300]|uniref:HAD family hydrolase n=1 Tax=Streptomyces sp. NPDC087300 TaxID=3365780 RepID=UPI003805A786
MSFLPELIATAIDGTLVGPDGAVSDRTFRAIDRAREQGIPLVLVTGRSPDWMLRTAVPMAHDGYAICSAGAFVYDVANRSIVQDRLIPHNSLRQTIDRLSAVLPGIGFAAECASGMIYETAYELGDRPPERIARPLADVSALAALPVAKLLARHPRIHADDLLAEAQRVAGELVSTTRSNAPRLIEMTARGVTRATTLIRLCEAWGIERDRVVAFGDGTHDLAMLGWAARGYAMANAHGSVLEATPWRTTSNAEHGVARVLEELVPPTMRSNAATRTWS